MVKILAIDDEQGFTDLVMNYFAPRGFKVLVAHEGRAGLKLAKAEAPEFCLIDLKMPGIHGDEVLKEIRATLPGSRCIMITASEGGGHTRARLKAMGAYTCFDKPLTSLKNLEQSIREAMSSDAL